MNYRKFPVTGLLSHSLLSYGFLKDNIPAVFTDCCFPNAHAAVVFHFGNRFLYRFGNMPWRSMYKVNFINCTMVPVWLRCRDNIDSVIVLLPPYAIHNIFGINLNATAHPIDAARYFSEVYLDNLQRANTYEQRLDLLNDYFNEKLKFYNPSVDLFKGFCDHIIHHKGLISRKDLADQFTISENYIHKLFMRRINISFKPFSQLVKICSILEEIYASSMTDWFEILEKYNYYDQSHFIKDFKKIAGYTPMQYIKLDKSFTSLFTDIS